LQTTRQAAQGGAGRDEAHNSSKGTVVEQELERPTPATFADALEREGRASEGDQQDYRRMEDKSDQNVGCDQREGRNDVDDA